MVPHTEIFRVKEKTLKTTSLLSNLYSRLNTIGLTPKYVRDTALPSWWDDDVAASEAGFAEGLLYLSRHLGLDFESMRDQNASIRMASPGVCKFKKNNSNVSDEKLSLVQAMAYRAASIVASTVKKNHSSIPSDALAIRNKILETGVPWVGLSHLLDYCWSIGVPVLYFDHFPKGIHRPAGFATRVGNQPVIVLSKKQKASSIQLFILAHEIAHLALGHVQNDSLLQDENVDSSNYGTGGDSEEREADAFALELICGDREREYRAYGRWPNAKLLARQAVEIGKKSMIDPGHIVFNYAHSMGNGFYPVAMVASKIIDPNDDATKTIRSRMIKNLDWSALPEDTSEFLMRITGHEKAS